MKNIEENKQSGIEFKYITGQDRIEEVQELFLEYAQSLKIDLDFQGFEKELKELPGKYGPPDGVLIIALVDGISAGCIALRRISEDICEMKRIYVRDCYRGFGLGKKLISLIIEEATKKNYRYIRLDTLPTQKKAQALYEELGFYDIEPYVYNPIIGTRFMEKEIKKAAYMGDKKYWDEKFAQRTDQLLKPETALVNSIKYFKPGTVLDIACGDGRNALFLIEKNFKVTGVDFSQNALERLERFAKEKNYTVNTQQIDLSIPGVLKNIGVFDNIVINHYRLTSEHFKELGNHLTDKGILFISGFGHRHIPDERIRREDLIQPTDFEELNTLFELINYEEVEDNRGFFVTFIFQRK